MREPTHNNAILDVAISSAPDTVRDINVTPQSLSKHKAVSVVLNFRTNPCMTFKRRIYDYKNADWPSLNTAIKEEKWDDVLSAKTADEMAEKWTKKFKYIMEKFIPTKLIKIYPNKSP